MSVTTEGATGGATLSQVYVTGLACAMASVRQMSQVWHVVRQMSQVWHVSWRLCVRCHGVCASDFMSHNVKTASRLTLAGGPLKHSGHQRYCKLFR